MFCVKVSMVTKVFKILHKTPNNPAICVYEEKKCDDSDGGGARSHYQRGRRRRSAHVDFFMPVLLKHLQKQSQLNSWSSGSRRNYFAANVFIYVFPHFQPVFVQLVVWAEYYCCHLFRSLERIKDRKIKPGRLKNPVGPVLVKRTEVEYWGCLNHHRRTPNETVLAQIVSPCFRGQVFAHCRCPAQLGPTLRWPLPVVTSGSLTLCTVAL